MHRVRSLQARIVLATMLLLALVFVLVGVASAIAMHGYLQGQLDDEVRRTSHFAAGPPGGGQAPRPPPQDPGGGFVGGPGRAPLTLEVHVDDGRVVAAESGPRGYAAPMPLQDAAPAIAVTPNPGERPQTIDLGDYGNFRVVAQPARDGTTVVAGIDTGGVDGTVARLLGTEAIVFAIGIVLAGIGSAFTTRLTLLPLHRVSATARRVSELPLESGEVDLAERVPTADADERSEVGQVGAAFNRMLGHVENALAARQESETRVRRFVADASHELRTPLAAIRGYSEFARRRSGELPDDVAGLLDRIGSQTERMTVLVEDLLLLARLDAGRPLARERVDLPRIVADAVTDAHVAAPGHHVALDLPGDLDDADGPALDVVGDPERLHQVVANLLANARTHTPEGTTVVVRLSGEDSATNPGKVRLEVADDGPGIAADLLPRVFERFARGDSGRARAGEPGNGGGSTGLGLSIVSAVLAEHGGTIGVTSRPGDTRFVVELPAAPVLLAPPSALPSRP